MIDALSALLGRLHGDPQAGHRLILADVLLEGARAQRALALPVGELAAAIARQDEKFLRGLPGVGPQKAKNMVAQLQNKVAKFALAREGAPAEPIAAAAAPVDADSLRELVWEIMVKQLGHRPSEASQLITDALRRRPSIMSPEELFDEIYRGQKA